MRKIPTLFQRDHTGSHLVLPELTAGCEWVLRGEGTATVKMDGSACMVRAGVLFKRYDCKRGRTGPPGWEPCEPDPDPNTGHWPGWVPVGDGPEDRWFREAFTHTQARDGPLHDWTYEAVGPHFQGNPQGYRQDHLVAHGVWPLVDLQISHLSYNRLLVYLSGPVVIGGLVTANVEGIVWWRKGPDPAGPWWSDAEAFYSEKAKIKRRDFGLPWPIPGRTHA